MTDRSSNTASGWLARTLGAGHEADLAALRRDLDQLARVVETLRGESAELKADRDRAVLALEETRREAAATILQLKQEIDKTHRTARDLLELGRTVEDDRERGEALGLKVAALAKQLDWDREDHRRGVQGLFERIEAKAPAARPSN